MSKDKVFSQKMKDIESFEFNEEVTNVFDDMINKGKSLEKF